MNKYIMPRDSAKLASDNFAWMDTRSREIIRRDANRFKLRLMRETPVKTGRMRRSWTLLSGRGEVVAKVVNLAPYAFLVLTKLINAQRRRLREVWDTGGTTG